MTYAAGTSQPPSYPQVDAGLRARLAADPQRPAYHFLPEANWLNDPNGLIQWKGRYHLFYQYNPNGPFHGTIHWGHAVSTDLAHWMHLPIALSPTPGGADQDGCFSGCAVDNDGVPTLIYTGVHGRQQRPCVATSADDLLTWKKYAGNPVIVGPPPGLEILEDVNFRDHSVWKEGGTWYQVVGSGIRGVGGAALLYRSKDLLNWEYLHPLCVGDHHGTEPVWSGSMWECPDFFRLDGKHVLVVSVWNEHRLHYPAYFIGTYSDHRFSPEAGGQVDWGRSFYAPQSMTDDQGRRIMFGWLREARGLDAQRAAGWSGVMSLPRRLSLLPNGTLGMEPVPELARLRGRRFVSSDVDGSPELLAGVRGAHLEIVAEWEPAAAKMVGLKVRCSPDHAEETLIAYDYAEKRLFVDRERSSLSEDAIRDIESGTLELAEGEGLKLQIFLDASVVEVFANGHACLVARIYPSRQDSLGLDLVARGGNAAPRVLDVYEMQSAWATGA